MSHFLFHSRRCTAFRSEFWLRGTVIIVDEKV